MPDANLRLSCTRQGGITPTRQAEAAMPDSGFRHPRAPQNANASKHPERYILGKPHADRAKQFKPFAALRGFEELVDQAMAEAAESHDFSAPEDPC